MMKDSKKYYKNVKKLMPIYGKREKEFLNSLEERLNLLKDCDYNNIVEELGEPKDMISTYYQNVDNDDLLEKVSIRRFIKVSIVILLVVVSAFCCYRAYIFQKEYDEIKNSMDGYFEEVIE